MGRIKTKRTKRISREILEKYPDKITDNFDSTKKNLTEIVGIRSKKLKNVISGYVVRLKKQEEL